MMSLLATLNARRISPEPHIDPATSPRHPYDFAIQNPPHFHRDLIPQFPRPYLPADPMVRLFAPRPTFLSIEQIKYPSIFLLLLFSFWVIW